MATLLQPALVLGERFLAAFLLFFLWGGLATIAIFIKATSGSPILVVDEWVTKSGSAVRGHRFRTTGPGLPVFRAAGRLFRAYALDELPSLWNVACGEVRLRDLNFLGRK
jgi:lipopolysaccharide/colanic/teichoic acid biosynthesis glycosyltransferase